MTVVKPAVKVRLVGMVRRVSTDLQAANDEGSLTTQLQRMRAHTAYKCEAVGEQWQEVDLYDMQVTSGKDSLRSPEFQRLLGDGRLDRISQPVSQLALLPDGLENRQSPPLKLAQIQQTLIQVAQMGIVKITRRLFAISRDERHR